MTDGRDHGAREPVRTTIVGGQPRVRTKASAAIPEGIERLIRHAAADTRFRSLMFADREEAARRANVKLTESERAVLLSIPNAQLAAIIEHTPAPAQSPRRGFLRAAVGGAGAWLAALLGGAATTAGCGPVKGIQPDVPPPKDDDTDREEKPVEEEGEVGPEPDGPPPATRGIQPDVPLDRQQTTGIRPDTPPKKGQ